MKMFNIHIRNCAPNGDSKGEITLGETETFPLRHDYFSREQYEEYWQFAIQRAVEDREPSFLLSTFDLWDDGFGSVSYYGLIPCEMAEGAGKPRASKAGVFLTEGFKTITIDPENLRKKRFVKTEDGEALWEEAVYYFSFEDPMRLAVYLCTSIADISSWYFENKAFYEFLS